MQKLACEEILLATKGCLLEGDPKTIFTNVNTDSRGICEGMLFIPIEGARFDGHDFIKTAFEQGAMGALTHKSITPQAGKVVIQVQDTQKALGDIARYYREKFHIPFVGITGSVGKTSTKDMISCVLAQQYSVLKTEGNFNNEIGLPLTLFRLDTQYEVGVIEMGMSGFGEISRLTSMVQPDIAIITNIGLSHIEKLGSRQNILKAKMEIFEGLKDQGLVILNGDDKLLFGLKGLLKQRVVFYGMEDDVEYQAYNITSEGEKGIQFNILIENQEYTVHVPAPGVHNVQNALAAIATGIELGVPMEKIIQGIFEFSPGKMRMNILNHSGIKIINDAYNASPQSMEAAIHVLCDIGRMNRKIAVLGDMLEMGAWAKKAHQDVGHFVASSGLEYLVTVGSDAQNIAAGALEAGMKSEHVFSFKGNEEASEFLKAFAASGDLVLVKGSRGMKMEEIITAMTQSDEK